MKFNITRTLTVDNSFMFNATDGDNKHKTDKDRVKELLDEVGKALGTPYYASFILSYNGSEILKIVERLEEKG